MVRVIELAPRYPLSWIYLSSSPGIKSVKEYEVWRSGRKDPS